MDTQQNFQSREDIDKLRLKNEELKKELEREQLLHKMLYNEWKQLSDQASAKENEIYESGRPKNLFYKYAFYVLLVAGAAAAYFLYFAGTGNNKEPEASPLVSIPVIHGDSVTTTALVKDSTLKNEPISASTAKQTNIEVPKQVVLKQPEVKEPQTKPEEKKAATPDDNRQVTTSVSKPVAEPPLTTEARDSIYWLGFNAYFNHSASSFKKSSPKYKVWLEGFNNGKAEAKKVAPDNLP